MGVAASWTSGLYNNKPQSTFYYAKPNIFWLKSHWTIYIAGSNECSVMWQYLSAYQHLVTGCTSNLWFNNLISISNLLTNKSSHVRSSKGFTLTLSAFENLTNVQQLIENEKICFGVNEFFAFRIAFMTWNIT